MLSGASLDVACPPPAAGPAQDMCRSCWGHQRRLPASATLVMGQGDGANPHTRSSSRSALPLLQVWQRSVALQRARELEQQVPRWVQSPGPRGALPFTAPTDRGVLAKGPPAALRMICSHGASRRRHRTGWGELPLITRSAEEEAPLVLVEKLRCGRGSPGQESWQGDLWMSLTAGLETVPGAFSPSPALPWCTWAVGLAAATRSPPALQAAPACAARLCQSRQPRQGHDTSTNPRRDRPCQPPGATPAPVV